MVASIAGRDGSKALNRDEVSILVSQSDGQVVGLSRAASGLLGAARNRPCWSLMHEITGAADLPCTESCVTALGSNERATESRRVTLRGRSFDLRCESVGDRIVTTLRPRPAPSTGNAPRLTPREVEVLKLLADGLEGSEIADRLGIRVGTVRTHVEHMRVNLDCRTRAALVAKGYQRGYLA